MKGRDLSNGAQRPGLQSKSGSSTASEGKGSAVFQSSCLVLEPFYLLHDSLSFSPQLIFLQRACIIILVASAKCHTKVSLFLMKYWPLWCLEQCPRMGTGAIQASVLMSPSPSEVLQEPLSQAHWPSSSGGEVLPKEKVSALKFTTYFLPIH